LKIALLNHTDFGGGAEKIALSLLNAYLDFGWDAWLFVGEKQTEHPNVISLQKKTFLWGGLPSIFNQNSNKSPNFWDLSDVFTKRNFKPSLIHFHNLHGGYFDLSQVKSLSEIAPILHTYHDFWPITGHCAFPMQCQGFLEACTDCPDPMRYPAEKADKIPEQFKIKRTLLNHPSIHSVFVSAYQSDIVAKATKLNDKFTVIPNGINSKIFYQGNREENRKKLGLESSKTYVLLAGKFSETNPYRDYNAIIEVLNYFESKYPEVKFLWAGNNRVGLLAERSSVINLGEINDEQQMATVFRAADVLFHPSLADSQGLTVLEAIACGTPVLCYDLPSYRPNLNQQNSVFVADLSNFPAALEGMISNPIIVPEGNNLVDWKETTHQYKQLIERLLC